MSLHIPLALAVVASLTLCVAQGGTPSSTAKTIYDFSVKRIDGSDVSLGDYKGHPLLIVNVASK